VAEHAAMPATPAAGPGWLRRSGVDRRRVPRDDPDRRAAEPAR
jgi:hypothetical protein